MESKSTKDMSYSSKFVLLPDFTLDYLLTLI